MKIKKKNCAMSGSHKEKKVGKKKNLANINQWVVKRNNL